MFQVLGVAIPREQNVTSDKKLSNVYIGHMYVPITVIVFRAHSFFKLSHKISPVGQ